MHKRKIVRKIASNLKHILLSFLMIGLLVSNFNTQLKADGVEDNINLIKKLSNEQDLLANTIELYIELYGASPTSVAQLKNSGLLDNSYSTVYFNNFTITVNSIIISSTYSNYEPYQSDFYLNNYSRNRVIEPTVASNSFSTKFYLNKESLNTLSYKDIVDFISPVMPSSTIVNKSWYDTRKKKVFYYIGGNWITLDAKKLWIVKSISELNSLVAIGATENDAGIILTLTSLDKYIYVSNQWYKIENVPYNYNTGF